MRNTDNDKIFRLFVLVRVSSVFFVETFYEADEYWQSLEVAHNLVYGYGDLTWEWKEGIRSYLHPLIFAALYKALAILELDNPHFISLLPRILQALLSAYADYAFFEWTGFKKWSIFCIISSWFWFYMGSRTLINTFETAVSTIALSNFPWTGKEKNENLSFLWIVGFVCIIRPTAIIMWIPLCIYHLAITKHTLLFLVLTKYLPIGVILLMSSILIDSLCYGTFTFSQYNFFKFNIFKDIASFYGVHPWYWYMSFGVPAVLGIYLMPFAIATLVILNHTEVHPNELVMLTTIVFTLTVLSFLPHKEFRFVTPLLPLMFFVTTKYLSVWSGKAKSLHLWIVAVILLIGNAIPVYYLGWVHQRGTLDVMHHLRSIAEKDPVNTNLLFLMPCHSTPMYSYLHVNVTTRYLTCTPNLQGVDNYVDETTEFYNNPNAWLRIHYPPNGSLPSHIITYNSLVPRISAILSRYRPILDIFHTDVPVSERIGTRILVHELNF